MTEVREIRQLTFRKVLISLLMLVSLSTAAQVPLVEISLQRVPDEGILPRLLLDENGITHLLYFKKRFASPRERNGDLYYRQFDSSTESWGIPVKVTSEPFNHSGSVGRGGFAVDGDGRIHVVWYTIRPDHYFYSRSNPQRSAFEEQRSMVTDNIVGVDAGADVAAKGNQVAIVWAAGDLQREQERTVFARISLDHGQTFSAELMLGNKSFGACACCTVATEFSPQSALRVAYRSAVEGIGRHMQLLTLSPIKATAGDSNYSNLHDLQRWELSSCPVTTNDLVLGPEQQEWMIFETESRIVEMNISAGTAPQQVADPLTQTRQKNPAMAFDKEGNRLIVWAEGISFTRGGQLNWQLFDAQGIKVPSIDKPDLTVTDDSFPAVLARPGGGFIILY